MKKIIILIISLFLLSGCSVKYDLDLTEDKVLEKTSILETNVSDPYFETLKNYKGELRAYINDQEPDVFDQDPDLEYYIYHNYSTDTKIDFELSYEFPNDQFKDSNIINNCYETINFDNYPNLEISTSNKFLCFDKYVSLDSVEVNIKTNKKITNHNADKITGNTYTWNINKINANNKPIILSAESEEQPQEDNKNNLTFTLIVIGAFIIFTFGLIIYKNHKYR